jgi:hypothetical protein
MSQSTELLSFGPHVAGWLRSTYSGSRAKRVAKDFGVSQATAKRWLAGEAPTAAALARMVNRFGWRFVSSICEPLVGCPAMQAEMSALEHRLSRLEAEKERDDAAGSVAFARLAPRQDSRPRRLARKAAAQTIAVAANRAAEAAP